MQPYSLLMLNKGIMPVVAWWVGLMLYCQGIGFSLEVCSVSNHMPSQEAGRMTVLLSTRGLSNILPLTSPGSVYAHVLLIMMTCLAMQQSVLEVLSTRYFDMY